MSQGAAGNPFIAGGVTPQQAGFSQFTRGEGTLGSEARFSGMPVSTGETQAAAVGPDVGQAVNLTEVSDALAAAQANFANQQQLTSKGVTQQQVGTLGHLLGKGSS